MRILDDMFFYNDNGELDALLADHCAFDLHYPDPLKKGRIRRCDPRMFSPLAGMGRGHTTMLRGTVRSRLECEARTLDFSQCPFRVQSLEIAFRRIP